MTARGRKTANRSSESYKQSWTPEVIESVICAILDMESDGTIVLDLPTVFEMMDTGEPRNNAESNEDFFIAVWLLKNAGQCNIEWKEVAERTGKTSQSVYQKPWTLIKNRKKRGQWAPVLPSDVPDPPSKKKKRAASATPNPRASAAPKKTKSPTPAYVPAQRTRHVQPEVTPYLTAPSAAVPRISRHLQRPSTAAHDNSPYVQRAAAKAAKKSSYLNKTQSDSPEIEDDDEDDEDYDPDDNKRKKPEKAKASKKRTRENSEGLEEHAPESSGSLKRPVSEGAGSLGKRKRSATVAEESKAETKAQPKRRKKEPLGMHNLGYTADDLEKKKKQKKKPPPKKSKRTKRKNEWEGSESDASEVIPRRVTRSQTRDSERQTSESESWASGADESDFSQPKRRRGKRSREEKEDATQPRKRLNKKEKRRLSTIQEQDEEADQEEEEGGENGEEGWEGYEDEEGEPVEYVEEEEEPEREPTSAEVWLERAKGMWDKKNGTIDPRLLDLRGQGDTTHGCWAQGCPGGLFCEMNGNLIPHQREQWSWPDNNELITDADVEHHKHRIKQATKRPRKHWRWHD